MSADFPSDYLAGLPEAQQADLTRVNKAGLADLREYLAAGEAIAFLGAGASAPLYPLWADLIGQLVDAAESALSGPQLATCRALAQRNPEEVVEILRRSLGAPAYRDLLREVFRARRDPVTGRSWTPVQELVCRCGFKGVVTTNYDPGIVNARMRVRPDAEATGFTTWQDELSLDGWRTGKVFGEAELPVLFAHGQHNQPDSIVLATTEYRRAYEGKLSRVLAGWSTAGTWHGSGSASPTSGSPRYCGRSRTGPARTSIQAPHPSTWRSWPGIRRMRPMTPGSWPSRRRSATVPGWCCIPHRTAIIPRWWCCCRRWPIRGSRAPPSCPPGPARR